MIHKIIAKLSQLKVKLHLVGNDLRLLNQGKEPIPEYLLAEIKDNKGAIVDFLNSHESEKAEPSNITKIPLNDNQLYDVSYAQRRLLVDWVVNPLSTAYNGFGVRLLKGKVNFDILRKSFTAVINRHEILRTSFHIVEESFRQKVHPINTLLFEIETVDLSMVTDAASEIMRRCKDYAEFHFDLKSPILFRVGLIHLNDKECLLLFANHHIIFDEWSGRVFIDELIGNYNAFRQNTFFNPPQIEIQYKDFTAWQNDLISSGALNKIRDFWIEKFSSPVQHLQLPYYSERPKIRTFPGSKIEFEVGDFLSSQVAEMCKHYQATLFVGLISSAFILLYRYSAQDDIVIGVPVAGREQPQLHNQIGFYLNTLPFRAKVTGTKSIADLLKEVREDSIQYFAGSGYPFDLLVDDLKIPRDPSHHPLFDTLFSLQYINGDRGVDRQNFEGVEQQIFKTELFSTKFDLSFYFFDNLGKLTFQIEFNTDLFDYDTVEKAGQHLISILNAMVKDQSLLIGEIKYLTSQTQQHILSCCTGLSAGYDLNRSLVMLFMQQSVLTPGRTAVFHNNRQISYEELDLRSTQFAGFLINNYDIRKTELVGLMCDRSEWMIFGLMGILKAGAAYVPIDPGYPRQRIEYILRDSGIRCVVVDKKYEVLDNAQGELIELPVIWKHIDEEPSVTLPVFVGSDHTAYVIYTSGSTGNPKGCIVPHRGVVNRIFWGIEQFGFTDNDVVLQRTPLVFDVSAAEIFTALCCGGALVICDKEAVFSPKLLVNYIEQYKITTVHFVPSLLLPFLDHLSVTGTEQLVSIRHIFSSGEVLPASLVRNFYDLFSVPLYNLYGPTEASIEVTYYKTSFADRFVPIGKPISNMRVYILDEFLGLCDFGMRGEICIGGVGVSGGYINRDVLTSERFVKDPFGTGMLYRTGDVGRLQSDGNIEYLGRMDSQIKLRGYRVELGEIESVMLSVSGVRSAVVALKGSSGSEYLVGYYTNDVMVELSELRRKLSEVLPVYMIPAYLIELESFPLTASGKIDREALVDPVERGIGASDRYEEGSTASELMLIGVWEEVLGRKRIGIHDNFFEVGGDSIKAIQISTRLLKHGYIMEIRDLFEAGTIGALSLKLRDRESTKQIDQSVVRGEVMLSPIQCWFFESDQPDAHHYNQSVLLYSAQGYERSLVEIVIGRLQEHHDALRINYRLEGKRIIQINNDIDYPVSVREYDLRGQRDWHSRLEDCCVQEQRNIDLEKGPLFRAAIIKGDDGDRLLLVIHHLLIDGISWRILFEDFSHLYQGLQKGEATELPLKTDSFLSWANGQKEHSDDPMFLDQEVEYWQRLESVAVEVLPLDGISGTNLVGESVTVGFELDSETTERLLTRVHGAYGTEINDILLTALLLSMRAAFGMDTLMVAMEGHGRQSVYGQKNISRTVGWFTSVYPLLLKGGKGNDLGLLLKEVKEIVREVPGKGVGYGMLRYLTKRELLTGLSFTSDPEVSFNYLGQLDADLSGASLMLAEESPAGNESPDRSRSYLIEVSGLIRDGKLGMEAAYSSRALGRGRMEFFKDQYEYWLGELIAHCCSRPQRELTRSDLTLIKLSEEEFSRVATADTQDVYPLSPMQEGLLFHWLYDGASEAYFEQVSYRVLGAVQLDCVQKSLSSLFKRHDVLRTTFVHSNLRRPVQKILRDREAEFIFEDWSDQKLPAKELEAKVAGYRKSDRKRSFDLTKDVLMRITVLKLSELEYEFVWSHHHILMDGWCMGILTAEYYELYNSYLRQEEWRGRPVRHYRNYIAWLNEQNWPESGRYWSTYLKGYDKSSPVQGSRPVEKRERATDGSLLFELGQKRSNELSALAATAHVSLNTVIETVWGILLSKYNNTRDVVFGSVVSGRPASIEGVDEMIGLFINTVPVRIRYEAGTTFSGLLQEVHRNAIAGTPHHNYPLADIQSGSELKQDLFNNIIAFENYPLTNRIEKIAQQNGLHVSEMESFEQTNYDVTLIILPGENILCNIKYKTDINDLWYIQNLLQHFELLITRIIKNPLAIIDKLSILTDYEYDQIINEFNPPFVEKTDFTSVISMFEKRAALNPDNIALVWNDQEMSYDRLNKMANQLAVKLSKEFDVKKNEVVGINMKRSELMLLSIIAILKAGATYVPIDNKYPTERKLYMTKDSGLKCLIVDEYRDWQSQCPATIVNVFELQSTLSQQRPDNQFLPGDPHDVAYILYTSGSTGVPKGCAIEHHSLSNYIVWANEFYIRDNIQGHFGLFSSLSFDFTITSIFCPLIKGNKIYVFDEEDSIDNILKYSFSTNSFIDVIKLTPSHISLLDDLGIQETNIKLIIAGGEVLTQQHIRIIENINSGIRIVNEYGPTESTVGCVVKEITSSKNPVTIGKPINNTRIYIVDHNFNPMPVGIAGQICIAGEGLARNYINQPQITSERFINNPFQSGTLMYQTGDIGKRLPDGDLVYLGRNDRQFKIRGYRVELKEIETVLSQFEGIDVAIVAIKGSDNLTIVAYYLSATEVVASRLYDYLGSCLPHFMIPSCFIKLDVLPLTVNGKLDFDKLPDPEKIPDDGKIHYDLPTNIIEKELAVILKTILARENIGIYDNFFAIGGHSVLAIRLLNNIEQVFKVRLSLKTIFENNSIYRIAKFIEAEAIRKQDHQIVHLPSVHRFGLTSIQRKMWVLSQFSQGASAYTIVSCFHIAGSIDKELLQTAFRYSIERHEILRTRFVWHQDEIRQEIYHPGELVFNFSFSSFLKQKVPENELTELINEEERNPIMLDSEMSLFRVKVVELSVNNFVLLFSIHHIISDAHSLKVIFDEVLFYYNCLLKKDVAFIPPLKRQFKDYVLLENSIAEDLQNEHRQYWRYKFVSGMPSLRLRTDFPQTKNRMFNGDVVEFEVSKELSDRVRQLTSDHQASVFMCLFATVNILLHKYTNQDEIIVGLPVSTRSSLSLEDQVGPYINTLPIKVTVTADDNFLTILERARVSVLEGYEHASYPLEALTEDPEVQRILKDKPVFEVIVNYENTRLGQYNYVDERFVISEYKLKNNKSQFMLAFDFFDNGDSVLCSINYDTDLFERISIVLMKERLLSILSEILHFTEQNISEINMDKFLQNELSINFGFDY